MYMCPSLSLLLQQFSPTCPTLLLHLWLSSSSLPLRQLPRSSVPVMLSDLHATNGGNLQPQLSPYHVKQWPLMLPLANSPPVTNVKKKHFFPCGPFTLISASSSRICSTFTGSLPPLLEAVIVQAFGLQQLV